MCRNWWRKIKNLEKEFVEQISHQIVEFSHQYVCQIIIFENLKSLNPNRKKYSVRSNIKRSFWVAKKIQKRTQQKALNRYSIYRRKALGRRHLFIREYCLLQEPVTISGTLGLKPHRRRERASELVGV